MRTYCIAEAGSCHDGDLSKALRLVEAAAGAGANAVKFQFFSDADQLANRRRVPPQYRAVYHRYRMPATWLPVLKGAAESVGLDFLCTTYLTEDVPFIAPFVKAMKIASFEAGDREFLEANRATGKPLIVSTGMMSLEQTYDLLDYLQYDPAYGQPENTLLHCVSAYPAPIASLNLAWLRDLAIVSPEIERHNARIGFSDHSAHWLTGALAVAAGAKVLETHVRLWDTDPRNLDWAPALPLNEPVAGSIQMVRHYEGYSRYVEMVRHAEAALGDGCKREDNPVEAAMAQYRVKGEQS